jgi:hypothetical protein
MRIATVMLLTALSANIALAQDQTLIGNSATYGGFGGPVIKLTRIAGKDAFLMGGRGGLTVNGTFVIGGAGRVGAASAFAGVTAFHTSST